MELLVKPIKALHGEIRLPDGEWNALCGLASILAASSYARSDLVIHGLDLGARGRRMLQVFRWMDARIETEKHRPEPGREPTATLRVRGSDLRPSKVSGETAAMFLREIPLWAVAGAFSTGEMVIRDVASLREGERDGIDVLVTSMRQMGIRVGEMPDGIVVDGGRRPQGRPVDAGSDGPLAVALALLAARAEGETLIQNADGIEAVWPGFVEEMEARAARTRHEVPA
jgi:3-phosphoshikimate 1-carboxyvinyltransferase